MMNLKYHFRKSAVEKTQYWELSDDGILYSPDGINTLCIPYANVNSLRLMFLANNRYRPNSYGCKINIASSSFDIYSSHYNGIADFKEQSEQYVPFVKELVRRVKAANPACVLKSGKTPAAYYGRMAIMVAAISLLIWILVITSDSLGGLSQGIIGSIFIKLLVVGFIGFFVIKSIRINRPKKIEGNEIPDDILPKIPGSLIMQKQ